jgi:hypothetical protein
MENKERNMRQTSHRDTAAETIGDTVIAILDRLAGKKSDLKLTFDDLTLDTGVMKARINGAIILETTMAKEP